MVVTEGPTSMWWYSVQNRLLRSDDTMLCKMELKLVVVLGFLSFVIGFEPYQQFVEHNDPGNLEITLKNMLVDKTNGDVFVGSTNRLYKLDRNLTELVRFKTGPVMDNLDCRPPPTVCESAIETNRINKLLLLYDDQLLTCSNIFQGSCQKRDINTLDVTSAYSREVVSNYEHGKAVGFIAPGPDGDALYTASPSGDWLRSGIPTLARRLLQPGLFDDPFDPVAAITIPVNTINEANVNAQYAFNISYVYGFWSGSHSYFIGLQVEEYKLDDSPQRTKIARVCNADSGRYVQSYIELPLRCSGGARNYILAQSAYLGTLGSDWGEITADEDVLFVVFAESVGGSSLEPTTKSAVCLYSVRSIDAMMAARRIECAQEATDNTEIEWLGNTPCFANPTVVSCTHSTSNRKPSKMFGKQMKLQPDFINTSDREFNI